MSQLVGDRKIVNTIITGDFNDKGGLIREDTEFVMCGLKNKMSHAPPCTSLQKELIVAEDGTVVKSIGEIRTTPGDYVMSSVDIKLLYALQIPYSSDHLPCVAIIYWKRKDGMRVVYSRETVKQRRQGRQSGNGSESFIA